ncbi:MAG: TylF/MycF/NovP-related O-methyltransferase [Caulobacterales bacterium]
MLSHTAYPQENLVFVPGMAEGTMASTLPDQIARLRLDTDPYASTSHELVHGYPKLSLGGVLSVDDYGYCLVARQATDQSIAESALPLFLARLIFSVRLAIKPAI